MEPTVSYVAPLPLLPEDSQLIPKNEAITARHRLVVVYPLDPRGQKIGGIESHVRLILEHAPKSWNVLFVGVDEFGDCSLGKVTTMTFRGRSIDFLPVIFFPESQINQAAKKLGQSLTFRFLFGMLRYFTSIKRGIGHGPATVELQRFEFALIPFLLNLPTVQVIHGEGSRDDKMDSLIKKFWFVHRLNEQIAIRLAHKIVGVNPNIVARLEKMNPKFAKRATFMPVPVDTKVFRVQDFDVSDNVLRVIFAGRLDEFKDPPTKFRVLARVHQLLNGACEFHYVGMSDPNRYAEFSLIKDFTICHGLQPAAKVAELMAHCHMGILTSFFEGMPCYLLELLSVGRPAAAIRLPQYDLVIDEGISGTMIERQAQDDLTVEKLASQIVTMWQAIKDKKISVLAIHAKAELFSVDLQFGAHFARHQSLAA